MDGEGLALPEELDVDFVAETMAAQEMMVHEAIADVDLMTATTLVDLDSQIQGQVAVQDSAILSAQLDIQTTMEQGIGLVDQICINSESCLQDSIGVGVESFNSALPGTVLVREYPCPVEDYSPDRIFHVASRPEAQYGYFVFSRTHFFENYWCQSYWPSSSVRPSQERQQGEGWYLYQNYELFTRIMNGQMLKEFLKSAFCWVYRLGGKDILSGFPSGDGFVIPPSAWAYTPYDRIAYSEMLPIEYVGGLENLGYTSPVCGCHDGTIPPWGESEPTPTPAPTPTPIPIPQPPPTTQVPCPSGNLVEVKCPKCECNFHLDPIKVQVEYPATTTPTTTPTQSTSEPYPVNWDNWPYMIGHARGKAWVREALRNLPAQVRTAIENGTPEGIAAIIYNIDPSNLSDDQPLVTPAQLRMIENDAILR